MVLYLGRTGGVGWGEGGGVDGPGGVGDRKDVQAAKSLFSEEGEIVHAHAIIMNAPKTSRNT